MRLVAATATDASSYTSIFNQSQELRLVAATSRSSNLYFLVARLESQRLGGREVATSREANFFKLFYLLIFRKFMKNGAFFVFTACPESRKHSSLGTPPDRPIL